MKKIKTQYVWLATALISIFVIWIFQSGRFEDLVVQMKIKSGHGVLICSDWTGYQYAQIGETVNIQIPIYDFDDVLLEGGKIKLDGFDAGSVEAIEFREEKSYPAYGVRYLLAVVSLVPEREGRFELNNMVLSVETLDGTLQESLGDWVFEIDSRLPENPLRIKGGSTVSQWARNPKTFGYRTRLFNAGNSDAFIERIDINHGKIDLEPSEIGLVLADGQEEVLEEVIKVDTGGNVLVRPKLSFSIDGKFQAMPLNRTIYASIMPWEEVLHRAKEKGIIQ